MDRVRPGASTDSTQSPRAKRPAVTVVMPFGGKQTEVSEAQGALASLELGPEDELILADNSGAVAGLDAVNVLPATRERSPAHARNAGAAAARGEWILFIDADCRPRRELLEAYFAEPIGDQVGALAGEVRGVPLPPNAAAEGTDGTPPRAPLAARYGAAKSFLSQRQHLAHPYRPRAVAANLLVRRAAFEQVGGFYEGLRAAEDTDFTWRLQQAGWRIELRPEAWVEHRYRSNLAELRRQWRGYAAGRAWLARRYDGFTPEPAVSRALSRVRRTRLFGAATEPVTPRAKPAATDADRVERGKYLAMDALLALEELAGFVLSNRPSQGEPQTARPVGAPVVFVADRFPSPGDPLIELPEQSGSEGRGRGTAAEDSSRGLRAAHRLSRGRRPGRAPGGSCASVHRPSAAQPARRVGAAPRRGVPHGPGTGRKAPAARARCEGSAAGWRRGRERGATAPGPGGSPNPVNQASCPGARRVR